MKNDKGITLISHVITIIVLIIIAGVAINFAIGENGIITKAQEAKKVQIIAEAKEKIGTEILAAQVESIERNEELEQAQIEDIISKYGELQVDGDTIILKDNGYEVSLLEIYNGTTSNSGGSTGNTELDNLKTELAKTNATSAQILKDYKAYSNGQLIAGTMENYAGKTQDATVSSDSDYTYLTIPKEGYYGTDSKLRMLNSNLSNISDGGYLANIRDTNKLNVTKGTYVACYTLHSGTKTNISSASIVSDNSSTVIEEINSFISSGADSSGEYNKTVTYKIIVENDSDNLYGTVYNSSAILSMVKIY